MSNSSHQRKRVASALLTLALFVAMPPPAAYAFHFPWDQGHDTTDWDDPENPGPCEGPNCDPCTSTGSPVYIPTGHFVWSDTDVVLQGRPTISVVRTFNSNDPRTGLFGKGWSFEHDTGLFRTIEGDGSGSGYALRMANGKRQNFAVDGDSGEAVAPDGVFLQVREPGDGSVELVDRGGNLSAYAGGQLTARRDANGLGMLFAYDGDGRLSLIDDERGRTLSFAYNSAGLIAALTDHSGRTWQYAYTAQGYLSEVTDPTGGVTRYEYRTYSESGDALTYAQLTRIVDPTGVVISDITYSNARVNSYTVGSNRYTYSYNDSNNTVTRTDIVGSRWTYGYNDQQLITSRTDPVGGSVAFAFNQDGLQTLIDDELGNDWTTTYDSQGRKLTQSSPSGLTFQFEYDGDRPEPARVTSPGGRITQIEYDGRGNVALVRDPDGFETRLEWSTAGYLTAVEDPLGQRSTMVPDAQGRPQELIDALGRSTAFTYDARGNIVRIQNATGEAFAFEYDALDRLTGVTAPDGARTANTYDGAGRLVEVTQPGGLTTRYDYDTLGRLVRRTRSDGEERNFVYRSDNLLSSMTLENGVVVTFSYDAAKRLTMQSFSGDASSTISLAYDARNLLTSLSNPAHTVAYTYDADERQLTETIDGRTVTSTYNADGERVALAAPGYAASYTRNNRGQVTQIDASNGVFGYEYDDAGRRTRLTLPNGSAVDLVYDVANQLTRMVHQGALDDTYTYDYTDAGFISQWGTDDFTWDYAYTSNFELSQAGRTGEQLSYAYDGAGNRVSDGGVHDNANRLVEDDFNTYTYDAVGRLVTKQDKASGARTVYDWNGRSQLVRLERYPDAQASQPDEVTEFTYGPLGRRLSRTKDGVLQQFAYDGFDRLQVLDGQGAVLETATFGPDLDEPLGVTTADGERYFHANHLGSIVAISDSAGGLVTEYDYSPFGKTLETVPTGNDFRFAAREYEADDLYYFRARYYDPELGRFISEDPLSFAGNDSNLYRYAAANPINGKDPTGEIAPALLAAWAIAEVGLAIYDAYDTASTIADPCSEPWERWLAGGLFVAGALLPGGGYSAADDVGEAAVRACCCFGEGTPVATPDGLKPIESLARGDLVASQDPATGEVAYQPITQLQVSLDKASYVVTLEDQDGEQEELRVTDNHPFYVVEQGWVDSADLQPGMQVDSREAGPLRVIDVIKTGLSPPAYNMSVGGPHTYFAGRSQALVHNCNCLTSIDEALDLADNFLDLGTPIRSVDGPTGVQFIQEGVDAAGNRITKRVGFDVNPGSGHVQNLGPHLNLQTQINGNVVRNGPLADPHLPIDPTTVRPGDY